MGEARPLTVVYTEPGLRDLDAILTYLGQHSPASAIRVGSRIREMIDELAYFPFQGRSSDVEGVRFVNVRPYPYLVFYEISGETLQVLFIRHGAREDAYDLSELGN